MVKKINMFYMDKCEELIDYIYKHHLEDSEEELLKQLIDIRTQLRFNKSLDDYLLRRFWRCYDETYKV